MRDKVGHLDIILEHVFTPFFLSKTIFNGSQVHSEDAFSITLNTFYNFAPVESVKMNGRGFRSSWGAIPFVCITKVRLFSLAVKFLGDYFVNVEHRGTI